MKKSIRKTILGVLSTSVGMYMMAAPLATTVHASAHEAPSMYNQTHNNYETQNPVAVVKASADKIGFDVNTDSFTLTSKTATTAVVNVVHDGTNYRVTLERSHQEKRRDQVKGQEQEKNRDQVKGQEQEKNRDQVKGQEQEKNRDHIKGQEQGKWIITSVDKS